MKLSIITICLNDKLGLERTIQSVTNQTFVDFEYIVIDGGSTDGSVYIVNKYADKINIHVSENDKGIYNAMNKGIDLASGEYCLFLNSGDYLVEENVLARVFSINTIADIIYGDMFLKGKDESLKYMKSPDKITIRRMLSDTLWHPVTFIRRKLFLDYGKYNEDYRIVSDYEFFVRVIIGRHVHTQYLEFAVSVFNDNGISSNKINYSKLIEERKSVQDMYFNPILLFLFRLYSKIRN